MNLYPVGRRAEVGITYAGRDVTADLAPYLLGLSYSDSLSGQADDVQIRLHDREGAWAGDWAPAFGDEVQAYVEAESWVHGGATRRLAFGRCAVDEVETAGPPATCTLKAVSAPLATGLRRTKRTRAWAAASLRTIAQDVADRAGLALLWSAPEFRFARQDQAHESDLAFLRRLCDEAGLALKVTDGQLAVFAEVDLEAGAPVVTLRPGGPGVLSWELRRSSTDVYAACVVRYRDPLRGRLVEAIAGATHRSGGKVVADEPTLATTRRVEDQAHAERLAAQLLRSANQRATEARVSVVGDPALVAGVVVAVERVYGLDGRYLVTEATHEAVGGYRTGLTLRRILEAA